MFSKILHITDEWPRAKGKKRTSSLLFVQCFSLHSFLLSLWRRYWFFFVEELLRHWQNRPRLICGRFEYFLFPPLSREKKKERKKEREGKKFKGRMCAIYARVNRWPLPLEKGKKLKWIFLSFLWICKYALFSFPIFFCSWRGEKVKGKKRNKREQVPFFLSLCFILFLSRTVT